MIKNMEILEMLQVRLEGLENDILELSNERIKRSDYDDYKIEDGDIPL